MKKRALSFGLLFFFIGFSLPMSAQDISINRPMGDGHFKSVSKARSTALSNTVLSVGAGWATVALFENNTIQTGGAMLGVYGIIMGPSTGNFYALDYPRGVVGLGARTVGAILMVDATREIFGDDFADALTVDDQKVSLTDTKILIGEALILGSIIYNVLSAKASVEEYNSGGRRFGLNVSPTVVDDTVTPVLTARFHF